jgi:hypothetical protein
VVWRGFEAWTAAAMFDAIKTTEPAVDNPCHERQEHRLDIEGRFVPDKLPGDYEHGIDKKVLTGVRLRNLIDYSLHLKECRATLK